MNTGTVSKTMLGKLLIYGVDRKWTFLSAKSTILTRTEVNIMKEDETLIFIILFVCFCSNVALATGPRTYYFLGDLAHLEQALIRFTLAKLKQKVCLCNDGQFNNNAHHAVSLCTLVLKTDVTV